MAQAGTDLKLWYRQPATPEEPQGPGGYWKNSKGWTEALPVGNGRLGAMVFGGTHRERIQLNEDTLWSGNPVEADNPHGAANLARIRQLLFEGKVTEAESLLPELFGGLPVGQEGVDSKSAFGAYQTLGDLFLDFDLAGEAKEYRRELDLDSATASCTYQVGHCRIRREVVSSYPDQVLAVRIEATAPLSFRVSLTRPENSETTVVKGDLVMQGQVSGEPGTRFEARVRIVCDDGSVSASGNQLEVTGTKKATLFISAATDYRRPKFQEYILDCLGKAAKGGYWNLRTRHLRDHHRLFRRVLLDLGATDEETPTDVRLERVRNGAEDLGLEALYFQYGRYLLIASSRPGSLPANLQGLWAEGIDTPWSADYHVNINLQMNYWLAQPTALSECEEPLIDYIEGLVPSGTRTAAVQYGAKGWTTHWVTNPWGFTAAGSNPAYGFFPAAGAWLCQHLIERYRFTGEKRHLSRAYPTMKGAAEFWMDFLKPDPKDGWLVGAPSSSPENRYLLPGGGSAGISYGATMETQIVGGLFDGVVEACRALGQDQKFRKEVEAMRCQLPPMRIGRHGQLMEWIEDYEEEEPRHRHISHLYGLHPGSEINPRQTPELARAARVVLERRLSSGGGHTGWSRAWIVNFFARLGDGDTARFHYLQLLRQSTLLNLFDSHPPFQIDGNFGGAAGVAEMLIQSHEDAIRVLPAMPKAWREGSFRGLRTRGGLMVDASWEDGQLRSVALTALRAVSTRIVFPNPMGLGNSTNLRKEHVLKMANSAKLKFNGPPSSR